MIVRLLRIVAALSLVLCAASVIAWIVTARRLDGLRYNSANETWALEAGLGGISASHYFSGFSELPIYHAWYTYSFAGDDLPADEVLLTHPRTLGFAWASEQQQISGVTVTTWLVRVPHWFIVLITAIPPLFWLSATLKRRRRRAAHQCVTCGYDLRATPERCPECGTAAAAAAAAGGGGGVNSTIASRASA